MMFLTVLLLGYLAALQLTAAYPMKEPAPRRLGKIEQDGGGEENTICIIYKDTGKKECHPIGKCMHVCFCYILYVFPWLFFIA